MIIVRPMQESEFNYVMENPHEHYIEGMAKAQGITYDEAKKIADKQVKEILKDGFHTKDHLFYGVDYIDEFAGFAWLHMRQDDKGTKSAWGYNIYVEPKFRRQGIAKKVFDELMMKLKEDGVDQVSFHVYADNLSAIALYEQYGFETTNIVMRKKL